MAHPIAPDPMAAEDAGLTAPVAPDLTAQDPVPIDHVAAGVVLDVAKVPAVVQPCLSVKPSTFPGLSRTTTSARAAKSRR